MRSRPERALRTAALALATLAPAALADGVRIVMQNSPLAGFRYADAPVLWTQLREGDALALVREPENPHDGRAVRVEWQGYKLGYLPRRENAALAWALDRGTPLRARIARLREHPNPARRIEIEVYVD
jgi:hypothetical protein